MVLLGRAPRLLKIRLPPALRPEGGRQEAVEVARQHGFGEGAREGAVVDGVHDAGEAGQEGGRAAAQDKKSLPRGEAYIAAMKKKAAGVICSHRHAVP